MPVIYQRYANAITFCRIKISAHEEPPTHNLKDQILSCFISLYNHCIWFNNVGFAHMVIKIPVIPTWRQSANVCSRNGSIAGWELIDLSDVVLEQYSTSYKVTSEAILFTAQAVVFFASDFGSTFGRRRSCRPDVGRMSARHGLLHCMHWMQPVMHSIEVEIHNIKTKCIYHWVHIRFPRWFESSSRYHFN